MLVAVLSPRPPSPTGRNDQGNDNLFDVGSNRVSMAWAGESQRCGR